MTRSLLLLLTMSWLLQGCAADPAPRTAVQEWRQSVERYVWDEGNGDPAVLRDATWDDIHPGFATLGDPLPDRSTDVFGLLLAYPRINDRSYFVFLVAVVHDQVIEQILPVALDVDAGNFYWTQGPPDDRQTRRYVDAQSDEPKSPGPLFPARDDTFDVFTEANVISIVHQQSDATWRIDLPPAPVKASPPIPPQAPQSGAAPDPPAPASPYPPPRPATAPADTSSTRPSEN